MYLIFFDEPCPLCNRAVRFILKHDRHHRFYFAPLGGETARTRNITELHTMVLLHHNRKETEGKAVLRTLWLLGGGYRLLGWLSYLPTLPFDLIYRLIARFRSRLCHTSIDDLPFNGRLLP